VQKSKLKVQNANIKIFNKNSPSWMPKGHRGNGGSRRVTVWVFAISNFKLFNLDRGGIIVEQRIKNII
jgi:hypothetical protein